MTLTELCEPLLLYICRLNRSVRKGGSASPAQVRNEITAIFEDMRARAGSEQVRLTDQFAKIELPLMFFVDFMIKESRLSFAGQWDELAYERNELAGDEKFFDLLDETLAEKGKLADERLEVFYACMGLGFTGWYSDQPEYVREKMLECSSRLHRMMDADETARICPEAYENVDTSDLVEPPGKKLLGIGIALVGFVIAVFITNIFMFRWASEDLLGALKKIIGHGG
ncbi:MAG: DotU family type IV/VI secretion system protein [Planctomycetes bacterium]|nr:DotU family type IV/VI secretion system protein [Planctomycetota bacterium]